MFAGIVAGVGTVVQPGSRLVVTGGMPYPIPVGGSVSVNGCCLTHLGGEGLAFDLSQETLSRTNLGGLVTGSRVNLEAALRVGDPLGGHFVQAHVDTTGEFLGREGETYRFRAPAEGGRYLVDKGAITIDGVSLTVIDPKESDFGAAIIPHTLASTNFGDRQPGDRVNLEYDLLARYLARLVGNQDF
ncbi:MAG: riboflavin synthase [Armatimonadetes bacterium]|nr:riboflavin synthase [Armatimonadota bacterium]